MARYTKIKFCTGCGVEQPVVYYWRDDHCTITYHNTVCSCGVQVGKDTTSYFRSPEEEARMRAEVKIILIGRR